MENLVSSLGLAIRQMRRNPGFTVAVVLTLALSIGANTAIFSVVNALMLKRLPYAEPERLGTIFARVKGSAADGEFRADIDGEQWEQLRDQAPSLLSAISGPQNSPVNLQAGSHVQYVHAGRVSARYFDVLALRPLIGRSFSEDEDRPHGPRAAILGYGLWRSAFGGDPNVPGRAVVVKGEPYTIVGVLPRGASTPLNSEIYIPLQPGRDGEGGGTNFEAIVRLRPGSTWQRADAEIRRAWANTLQVRHFAEENPGARMTFSCVALQKGETVRLRPQALALMLATGFILLIACANLAGLTLVRMLRRTQEIATRLALGASAWQIQRQLWIENLLLAAIGGAAGIAVGVVALRGLLLLLPEHFLPVAEVSLDGRVLGFTALTALLTSVLFGMLPALTMRKIELRSAMATRAVIGAGNVRLRQSLIAGEVALTVVLLAAAGLLIRTLVHLETLPPGFEPSGVIAARASLDDVRYHDPQAFRKLLNDSLENMRTIPGVENAAVALSLPYERALLSGVTVPDGDEAGHKVMARDVYVTPAFFQTLQIPVLVGRTFTDADGPGAPRVVVVNQTFARKFFHQANPVGRYLEKKLIVGVVGDTVLSSAGHGSAGPAPLTKEEAIYVPAAQIDDPVFLTNVHTWFQPSWVVRAAHATDGLTARMQQALAAASPGLPFSGFYSMKDLMTSTLALQRIEMALLAGMASLALLLSAVGIFGLVANLVAQRAREIGIRMALGSTIQSAMVHVGLSGIRASAAGLALGLVLCAGALRGMRSVIFGVGAYDAATIVGVVATLSAMALVATAVPAFRVAGIDPARILREE